MSNIINSLKDRLLEFEKFNGNGRIITNMVDFKKETITDTKQYLFYIRINDLNSLDDYNISGSERLLGEIRSSWVAVFQIPEEANDNIIDYFFSVVLKFDGCVRGVSMTTDTEKIYSSEDKIKDPNRSDKPLHYPFKLGMLRFNVIQETSFYVKINDEECQNC